MEQAVDPAEVLLAVVGVLLPEVGRAGGEGAHADARAAGPARAEEVLHAVLAGEQAAAEVEVDLLRLAVDPVPPEAVSQLDDLLRIVRIGEQGCDGDDRRGQRGHSRGG